MRAALTSLRCSCWTSTCGTCVVLTARSGDAWCTTAIRAAVCDSECWAERALLGERCHSATTVPVRASATDSECGCRSASSAPGLAQVHTAPDPFALSPASLLSPALRLALLFASIFPVSSLLLRPAHATRRSLAEPHSTLASIGRAANVVSPRPQCVHIGLCAARPPWRCSEFGRLPAVSRLSGPACGRVLARGSSAALRRARPRLRSAKQGSRRPPMFGATLLGRSRTNAPW